VDRSANASSMATSRSITGTAHGVRVQYGRIP